MPLENFATSDHDPLFGIANGAEGVHYTPAKQNLSTDDISVLANAAKNINISSANHGLSTYEIFLIEDAVRNISQVSADKSPSTEDMFLSDAENINVTSAGQVSNTGSLSVVENATQNKNLTLVDLSLSSENASTTESSTKIDDFSSADQGASADNEKNAALNVNFASADQVANKDDNSYAECAAQNVHHTSAVQVGSADKEKNAALNVNLISADHDASADSEENVALNNNLTSADRVLSADNEKNATLKVNLTSADQVASADNEKNAALNVNLTSADQGASAYNEKNATLNVNLTSADRDLSTDNEDNAAQNVNNFISEDLLAYLSLHSFSILDRPQENVSVESSMAVPLTTSNNEKTTFIKELPIRWPETSNIDTNSSNDNGAREGSSTSLQTFDHSNIDSLEDTISLPLDSGSIPPSDTSILPSNSSSTLPLKSSSTLPLDSSILPSENSTLLALDRLENSDFSPLNISGLQQLVNSSLSPLENNTVSLVEDNNTLSSMISSTLPPLNNLEEPMEEKPMAACVAENGRPEETLNSLFTADIKTDPEARVTTSLPTERTTTKPAVSQTRTDSGTSSNIKTFTIIPQVIQIDPVQILGTSLESKSPSADAILPMSGYNITEETQSFVSHSTQLPRQATSQAQSFASFNATTVNLTTTQPFGPKFNATAITAVTTSTKADLSDSATTEATSHVQSVPGSASKGSSEYEGLIEKEWPAEDHLPTGNKSLELNETVQKTCVADCDVEVVTPANEESLSLEAGGLDESSPASIVFPATEVKGEARPAAQERKSRDRPSASIPGGGLPPGWSRPLSDLFWRLEAAEEKDLSSRLTSGRPTLSYNDLSLGGSLGAVRRPERTFLFADIGGQRLPYYDLRPPDQRLMRSQNGRLYLE
jgi:hypothetical protein